jgi:alpha-galactosidase
MQSWSLEAGVLTCTRLPSQSRAYSCGTVLDFDQLPPFCPGFRAFEREQDRAPGHLDLFGTPCADAHACVRYEKEYTLSAKLSYPVAMAKIAVIGAGSAVFSLNFIRDLCLRPNLRGSSVHFMDIDPARLNGAYGLCTRYAQEVGLALDLHKTTDRRDALQGADIVLNLALAAGHQRLRAGWEVARQFGYTWGGSLHVMHDEAFWINFYQLQLFESLMRDMQDVCPRAFYIQLDNPVMAGMTLLHRDYPHMHGRMVGLCHGYAAVYRLAEQLGLSREGLTYEIPGVNHFVWLTKLYSHGVDMMPRVREWAAAQPNSKLADLCRRIGAYPIGDTGTDGGGSWGWWYHRDEATAERWHEDPGAFWQGYFSGGEAMVARIQRAAQDKSIRVTETFPPGESDELMLPMIESLLCDIPRVLIGNVGNAGAYVPGVPRDFAVEVPTLVSARGIQPISTSPLPPAALAYLMRDSVVPVNLELAAYKNRDKQLLVELVMLDPYTTSEAQARAMIDAVLAMPIHTELRAHYA